MPIAKYKDKIMCFLGETTNLELWTTMTILWFYSGTMYGSDINT